MRTAAATARASPLTISEPQCVNTARRTFADAHQAAASSLVPKNDLRCPRWSWLNHALQRQVAPGRGHGSRFGRPGPPRSGDTSGGSWRNLLVVATDAIDERIVRDELLADEIASGATVHVVAPASDVSPLEWLTNDEDEARAKAERTAERVAHAVGPAAHVEAEVGDRNPLLAIEDGLAHLSRRRDRRRRKTGRRARRGSPPRGARALRATGAPPFHSPCRRRHR